MRCLFITIVACLAAVGAAADEGATVQLSEIRIDQRGSDTDEFFEIAGPAGTDLTGLTLLVLGDAPGAGSGVIEEVVDLAGRVIPESGFFVAAESSFTLGEVQMTADLNFEPSDNLSFFLVRGFTGEDGMDLDTNDDGELDIVPWAAIVDQVALVEERNPPFLTEKHYGEVVVGPAGYYVPHHVFRSPSTGEWIIGSEELHAFDTPGEVNAETGPQQSAAE